MAIDDEGWGSPRKSVLSRVPAIDPKDVQLDKSPHSRENIKYRGRKPPKDTPIQRLPIVDVGPVTVNTVWLKSCRFEELFSMAEFGRQKMANNIDNAYDIYGRVVGNYQQQAYDYWKKSVSILEQEMAIRFTEKINAKELKPIPVKLDDFFSDNE